MSGLPKDSAMAFKVRLSQEVTACPVGPSLEGGVILCPWKSNSTQRTFKSSSVLNCLSYRPIPKWQN